MLKFKNKFELSPRLKSGVGRNSPKNRLLKISSFVFLVIAVGLTVNSLWIVFSQKPHAGQADSAPQVLGVSDAGQVSAEPEIQYEEYKVKKGDTLFNISQRYNIHWMTVATLNGLKSPFSLKPGQVIKIPR